MSPPPMPPKHEQAQQMTQPSPPPRPLQMGAKGAYIVRLLMVGDSACGKTSLVLRFDQNVFSTKFVTTIGVDYRDKMITLDNHVSMRLQLWDTAGQERFRSLTSNFFGRADGFVLTYDVSSRPSFDHVLGWMRDIQTRAPPDCDIVLCANKADLEHDRVVSQAEGQQLADEYGVLFFETSALTGQNVEKMFMALAATIKRQRIDRLLEEQAPANAVGGNPTNSGSSKGAAGGDNNNRNGTAATQKSGSASNNESRTIKLGGSETADSNGANNGGKLSSCCS